MKRTAILLLAVASFAIAQTEWSERYARHALEELDGIRVYKCGVIPEITACFEFQANGSVDARDRLQRSLHRDGVVQAGEWNRVEDVYGWLGAFEIENGTEDLLWVYLIPGPNGLFDVQLVHYPD